MTRQQKKALRQQRSTRQLMGITKLTEHGMMTPSGELIFYLIQPDNLSVLSSEGVRSRVRALTDVFRTISNVDVLALDSRASFRLNKEHCQRRLEQEEVPAIRELLRQEMELLDKIQTSSASAREFVLVLRLEGNTLAEPAFLRQTEKAINDQGIPARLADEQDIKRLLAVYYQHDVTAEYFGELDGEEFVINGKI